MAIWAVSLVTYGASPPSSNCRTVALGIRSLIGSVAFRPIRTFQCSTPQRNIRRKPESSFGENQLLPGSISFSLQPTSHPRMLHNSRVRPSLLISEKFSLLMGSSPGFGSDTNDKPSSTFAFRTLATSTNQTHVFGTVSSPKLHLQKWSWANALFTLAFAATPCFGHLVKPFASTRWLILQ